jgi:hypothetical protein
MIMMQSYGNISFICWQRELGLPCADTRVLQISETYHTLISRCFDRTEQGRRIHFVSAMMLLGLHDGDNAMNGYGYLNIVDLIVRHCADVERNLRELYRRIAFNI